MVLNINLYPLGKIIKFYVIFKKFIKKGVKSNNQPKIYN